MSATITGGITVACPVATVLLQLPLTRRVWFTAPSARTKTSSSAPATELKAREADRETASATGAHADQRPLVAVTVGVAADGARVAATARTIAPKAAGASTRRQRVTRANHVIATVGGTGTA